MRLSGNSILKFSNMTTLCVCVRVCVCVCVCVCAHARSVVSDSAAPWAVAWDSPLSMGFSRWEDWNGLPLFPPGGLPDPGIWSLSFAFHALPGSLLHCTTWETPVTILWECIKHFLEAFGLWTFIVFVCAGKYQWTLLLGIGLWKRSEVSCSWLWLWIRITV